MNIDEYKEQIVDIIKKLHNYRKIVIIYNFISKISNNSDH